MGKFRLPVSRPRFSLRANSLRPMPVKTGNEAKTQGKKKKKKKDSVHTSLRQKNRNNRIRRLSR